MSAAPPLVSVAMAMRNSERTIAESIASIVAQTYPHWELLLVDDGSSDGSVRVAEQFGDPRIRLFVDGEGKGLARRLNEIVARASGRYIARMDADDVSFPERFASQVAYLERHPDVDVVGASALVFRGAGDPVGMLSARETHDAICRRPWAGFYLPHPTWMGPVEWFRAHPYDEGSRSEDQALLLSSYRSSRFAALPMPLLGYRQDSIPLRKVLIGRFHFSRALLESAPGLAWRGIPEQLAKLAFDLFAISTGQERKLLRHRAMPLSPEHTQRWHAVWASIQADLVRRDIHPIRQCAASPG